MQPQFGQPQNPNPYALPQPGTPKKTIFLMFGGVIALLAIAAWLFLSGGSNAGEADLRDGLQNTADAVAIVDSYAKDLKTTDVKNDVALVQILLRGNYQKLNAMYNDSYKPGQKLPNNPKVDATSKASLDAARRSNVIDSEIFKVLAGKIQIAEQSLSQARTAIADPADRAVVESTQEDLAAIADIIDKAR